MLSNNYTPEVYPRYDNYEAIEVSRLRDIPMDWEGVMGVPITFLDRYNPRQFEILGQTGVIDPVDICLEYKGGRPYLHSRRMYARLLIRKRKS